MSCVDIDFSHIKPFVDEAQIAALQPDVQRIHDRMEKGEGEGSEFLGWLHLPSRVEEAGLRALEETAQDIRANADVFICIGIGGSYLGAKAALEFLSPAFYNEMPPEKRRAPEVYFAGHNISSDYFADLLELIEGRRVFLNVISKSGTTTEPALAFRVFREALVKKVGHQEARRRIAVTTDRSKGALKRLADQEGYRAFVIPDDVGGRFSVLTPVGLLPMAAAGIDIRQLLAGACAGETAASGTADVFRNLSYLYAAIRSLLYRQGKAIEVMASFHHSLKYVLEWWKQLAGESEGKGRKGIFPASVEFTTDLHSLGQWIQDGNRIIFETFLKLRSSRQQVLVPKCEDDGDGLNYLAGQSLDYINDKAWQGTAMAHFAGEAPNMTISLRDKSAAALGELFYFFERAIAMSGYLLEVNPFDQPGVEFYKKNMFALLKKPGCEKG